MDKDKRSESSVSRILFLRGVTPQQATIIHLVDAGCPAPLATDPEARAGRPQSLPYLVLHRVGLPSFSGHPKNWCALTAPFHPYPISNNSLLDVRRSALCCTFLHVAATPRYGAPCPVVFGLSSSPV